MGQWLRRTSYYLVTLFGLMLLYSAVYHYGITVVEGRSATFLHSVQIVVETFTATGYGSDSPWTTPEMNLLVILMDLTGVALIFLALPVFLFPLLEETLTTTAPTSIDREDHVVICGFTSRGEALVDELVVHGVPYAIVEADRDHAADIHETESNVVHADPETREGLSKAAVEDARAVVADVDDETNASIALTASRVGGVQVTTFVSDPDVADYHRYAGADRVFSPRQLVGESLARKVLAGVTPELDDAVQLDGDFEIAELPVQAESDLAGRTIAESGIRERTGTNVVGAWFRGEFVSPPSPDARIDEQTILLVAGRDAQLERLKELTFSERRQRRAEQVIVAGHGEVGSTVRASLADESLDCVVVDRTDGPEVDVVGDATDEETLRAAGVEDTGTVILALPDDTTTVFATLVVREVAPDVEVIARADTPGSVPKLYQAGADYVLALATVSGRMLASTILGEDVLSYDQQVEVVRTDAGALAGRTLDGADVRARTDCTVIAVERGEDLLTDFAPDFRIEAGDNLVVAGTDEDVSRFTALVD